MSGVPWRSDSHGNGSQRDYTRQWNTIALDFKLRVGPVEPYVDLDGDTDTALELYKTLLVRKPCASLTAES